MLINSVYQEDISNSTIAGNNNNSSDNDNRNISLTTLEMLRSCIASGTEGILQQYDEDNCNFIWMQILYFHIRIKQV